MIIDGVFKSLPDQVEEYRNLLANTICKDLNGGKLFGCCNVASLVNIVD